jgi:hypothetical protein
MVKELEIISDTISSKIKKIKSILFESEISIRINLYGVTILGILFGIVSLYLGSPVASIVFFISSGIDTYINRTYDGNKMLRLNEDSKRAFIGVILFGYSYSTGIGPLGYLPAAAITILYISSRYKEYHMT